MLRAFCGSQMVLAEVLVGRVLNSSARRKPCLQHCLLAGVCHIFGSTVLKSLFSQQSFQTEVSKLAS